MILGWMLLATTWNMVPTEYPHSGLAFKAALETAQNLKAVALEMEFIEEKVEKISGKGPTARARAH